MRDSTVQEVMNQLEDIFNDAVLIHGLFIKQSSEFSDIAVKEAHMIYAIGHLGEPTVSEISHYLLVTKPTVTASLNHLEEKGYLTRLTSLSDRRVVRIRLTARGRKLNKVRLGFHKQMVESVAAREDDESLQIGTRFLAKIGTYMEATRKVMTAEYCKNVKVSEWKETDHSIDTMK